MGRARPVIEPDDYICLYNVACVYARLGSPDKALDLLERAMPGVSAYRQAWMRHDPDMDFLRDHPRFVALLRALGAEPPPR